MESWFRSYRTVWMLGPVVLGLLALAGWIHARLAGLPVLETIVTYNEWLAALLLLPYLATMGTAVTGSTRGRDKPERPALVSMGYVLGLIVFAFALAVRALYGLGWEPFLVG